MSCPCGLTKQEVLELAKLTNGGVALVGGYCQNPLADGSVGICGRALGAHPSSQQTSANVPTAENPKKRKSIDQLKEISAEKPELFEEHETLKSDCMEYLHKCLQLERQVQNLNETVKVYSSRGRETVIRSFYEVVMEKFKNDSWNIVRQLYVLLYHQEACDGTLLKDLPSYEEIVTADVVNSEYFADWVKFFRSKPNWESWQEKFANTVQVVSKLDHLHKADARNIRSALMTIYGKLSDEIHKASDCFEGDGKFLLPHPNGRLNVDDIYAIATIVKYVGLIPTYSMVGDADKLKDSSSSSTI
jgi:hypothetical protein